MAHEYMNEVVSRFLSQMDGMGGTLAKFSMDVTKKQEAILSALDDFQQAASHLKQKYMVTGNHCNAVERETNTALEAIDQILTGWNEKKKENVKGTEFMNKHQKYLVVMIFGAVNTGKSSLGNFIAGKSFVDAPFDNAFKHRSAPVFESEESGRQTGGIEKDASGRQSFKVGCLDTTGSIQYFTLSGLRWMDSPGTGAIAKEGDQVNMEKLVEEYLPYTDFCLFLQNSSEPGLQADMKYIQKLTREGQEALMLITRSDIKDIDFDNEGNPVMMLLSKSPETRKLQEEDVLKRFKETYPGVDNAKYQIFSISTALAEEAVKSDDDEKFRASHVDLLMERLGTSFVNQAGQLKQKRVRKTVNGFIDHLISGEDGEEGLSQMNERNQKILEARASYIRTMGARKERICKRIQSIIHQKIRAQAEIWDQEASKGHAVKADEAEKIISDIIGRHIAEEINKEIGEIIDHFKGAALQQFQGNLNVGGIEQKTKIIEKTYKEKVVDPREPDGIWEDFCSFFFDTEYYTTYYKDVKKKIRINMGSNMEEYMERLNPVVSKAVEEYVSAALAGIEKDYFAPQEQYVKQIEQAMNDLRKKLADVKFAEG